MSDRPERKLFSSRMSRASSKHANAHPRRLLAAPARKLVRFALRLRPALTSSDKLTLSNVQKDKVLYLLKYNGARVVFLNDRVTFFVEIICLTTRYF